MLLILSITIHLRDYSTNRSLGCESNCDRNVGSEFEKGGDSSEQSGYLALGVSNGGCSSYIRSHSPKRLRDRVKL